MKKTLLLFSFSFFLTNFMHAQVYTETFDSGIPADWVTYTEAGFDFVNWFGGEVSLFKQSSGDELLLIGTEELDLSLYTRLEIDMNGANLAFNSDTKPYAHIGILTDPEDISSFEPIQILHVQNIAYELKVVELGAYNGMGHIAIKMVGEKSQIIYIDNFKLFDEPSSSEFPLAVTDLSITPGPNGAEYGNASWTNPTLAANGTPLTNLDSIVFYNFDGTHIFTHLNPTIGAMDMAEVLVDSSDFYQFEVKAFVSDNAGYSAFSTVEWLGLDLPGEVDNLDISLTGDLVEINWSAPTIGSNNGFFDGVITGYSITRSDGAFYSIPSTGNSFSETLPNPLGSFNYEVIAENASGAGDGKFTDPIHYDSDDYILYEDFLVDVVQSAGEPNSGFDFFWVNQSTTGLTSWTHFFSDLTGTGAGELSLPWTGQNQGGTQTIRAISPKLNTTGSETITIQFYHLLEQGNTALNFVLETTSDGGVTWNEVSDWTVVNQNIEEEVTKVIANDDVGSADFQFAFSFVGNPFFLEFVRYDDIRVFDQPAIDVRVFDFSIPNTIEPTNNLALQAEIENISTQIIDCEARCTVKDRFNSDVLYENIINVTDLQIGEIKALDFGTWEGIEGEYVVEVEVVNPDDQVVANNLSAQNLNVFQLMARDLVIIEEFTGTWCVYCPGAALGIEDLYGLGHPVAAVAYHRSDPYETPTVQDKMDYYSITGFPTVVFDGVVKESGGHQSQSIVGSYIPIVNDRAGVGSPVSIIAEGITYNIDHFGADININSISPIQNPNLKLIVILTESEIEDEWQGLSKLDYVERAYFKFDIDLSSNQDNVSFDFMTTDIFNYDHLEYVIFVQDIESGEIFNGIISEVDDIIDNVEDLSNLTTLLISPNPFSNELTLQLDQLGTANEATIFIYDLNGKTMQERKINLASSSEKVAVDTNDLPVGFYSLKVQIGDNHIVRRIVKQ